MTPLLVAALLAQAPVHRFAVVVGSNVGEGVRAAPLAYADDDALAMHELLLEAGVESVLLASPDADTRRLHPHTRPLAPPTLDALRGAVAAQRASMLRARDAGEDVEWLFFFSGHGDVAQGEGFLGLEAGRLTRAVLHDDVLAQVPAVRSHVVLDACRAGAVVGSKGPGGLRLPMPTAFAADPSWPSNVGFVLSASAAKDSHEWERLQSGVFSYEVRSALRGAADADGDGRVSYAELGAFLETANRTIDNPRLRPDFVTLPPRGKEGLSLAVLAWPARGVEATLGEHAYVERENGERLLDVHAGDGVTRLHLPSERPLYFRSHDEAREAVLLADATRVDALAAAGDTLRRKGARALALEALFATPFGEAQVDAYVDGWRPVDLSSMVVPGPPPAVRVGRAVAGWSVLGGLAVGAGGFIAAWRLQADGLVLDQRARAERNQAVTTANAVGVAGLVLSGVAAMAWTWLSTRWDLPLVPFVAVGPDAAGPMVGFVLR